MEIEYKGEKYRIKYTHIRPRKDGIVQAKGGTTLAFITDKKDKSVIASGMANVSIKDTYRKKLGRTIAEGRLLKTLGLLPRQRC